MVVVDASVLVDALLIDGVARLQALATTQQLGLRRFASRHLWPRAWELRTNLSACDAFYVALAEQLGATLLTADTRAARTPGLRFSVELLTA